MCHHIKCMTIWNTYNMKLNQARGQHVEHYQMASRFGRCVLDLVEDISNGSHRGWDSESAHYQKQSSYTNVLTSMNRRPPAAAYPNSTMELSKSGQRRPSLGCMCVVKPSSYVNTWTKPNHDDICVLTAPVLDLRMLDHPMRVVVGMAGGVYDGPTVSGKLR